MRADKDGEDLSKIGILYICTGQYSLFWSDFYRTFSDRFCNASELHFFVFSDREDMLLGGNDSAVHFKKIDNQPWPLVTLLRFNIFLSVEPDLMEMDYLFFFNANMVCKEMVMEEEILPSPDERLVFVRHPGYMNTGKIFMPYDRNPHSSAYIPYNRGDLYVIGAVEGGEAAAFIALCRMLKDNIEKDLKQNIIAKWHDESHINHYVHTEAGKGCKILPPSYCYPVGFDVPCESKIAGVSKQDRFDVAQFKTVRVKQGFLKKCVRKVWENIAPFVLFIKSCLLFEEVR
ncbi:MAG: hypothetical protein J1E07_06005 [Treponema sp.]|nr:hypothetical protein [Treponema sp.]